jgi:histidinol dehydrogenase
MRIIVGAEEGRRTVLLRRSLTEMDVPPAVRDLTRRVLGADLSPAEAVARIIADVRAEGDAALLHYGEAFDGTAPSSLTVSVEQRQAAFGAVDPELVANLRFAASRIRMFHETQLENCQTNFSRGGLGMRVRPIERIGMYAAGTAVVYPSSILMTVIPAKVAGVNEMLVTTPAGPDGRVSPLKLVAADIAGVDAVFCASGAQAIAAMAYGTQTIPKVDKICGPGNLFVTLAKQQLFGAVGIDAMYGPTETIIIADDSADAAFCAADLLAQAEHDAMARPILLTPSLPFAKAIEQEIERQLAEVERSDVASIALDNGGAVVTAGIEEAIDLANEFAPEHLCLLIRDAGRWVDSVRNAGGLFVGESSPEAMGDYTAGPSHVMPTGGSARYSSPLNVLDFLKITNVVEVDADALRELGPAAAAIARAEGLTAHARAIEMRLEKRDDGAR